MMPTPTPSVIRGPLQIWTIRSTTTSGSRVVLTSDQPDGEHVAVMDRVAVLRMVRIDQPVAAVQDVERAEPAHDLTAV